MGKASKLKAIRRIASQLPVIHVRQVKSQILTGEELIQKGVTTYDGNITPTDIDPNQRYKHVATVAVPINHKRQMKRLYNNGGTAGVAGYIGAVKDHMIQVAEKAALQ